MSKEKPTQKERVLEALEKSGASGVTTIEMMTGGLGEPILRGASRVDELRQQGNNIVTVPLANRTARYVLAKFLEEAEQ